MGTLVRCTAGIALGLVALFVVGGVRVGTDGDADVATPGARVDLGRLPLRFEANRGQADDRVDYVARGQGYSLLLTGEGAVLGLRGEDANAVLRMRLDGAAPAPHAEGLDEQPGRASYFLGNDPESWRTGVPSYARVRYGDVWPGVDLVYYGNQGRLEYDFVVAPGADPQQVAISFEGVEGLEVNEEGDLVLATGAGEVILEEPLVYQERGRHREKVEGSYVVRGAATVGFEVGAHDPARPLVIDPILEYSTFLGGSEMDSGSSLAVGPDGSVVVIGQTNSIDFPVTPGVVQPTYNGGNQWDLFVTKVNAAGTALLFSTYIGGGSTDLPGSVRVDESGNVYVSGSTLSNDFPTVNALQSTKSVWYDNFLLKLGQAGDTILFSTYLGGSGGEGNVVLALSASGNVVLGGRTDSADFPTTADALQPAIAGGQDIYVAVMSADGSSLLYSTFFGGSGNEWIGDLALGADGSIHVTGTTFSLDFPTLNPLQPALGGSRDGFLAKMRPDGSALVYSTYLGGSGVDSAWGVEVGATGSAYVVGGTMSVDFPGAAASPIQPTIGGGADGFLCRLDPSGTRLVFATYLGGSAPDRLYEVAVNEDGDLWVAGRSGSPDVPLVNPIQDALAGDWDALVAKVDRSGTTLMFATLLGSAGRDAAYGLELGDPGEVLVWGTCGAADFPTVNSLQFYGGGRFDAFLARLVELPADIEVPTGPIDFGIVAAWDEATAAVTIANVGAQALTVSDLSLASGGAFYFSITSAPATPFVLGGGQSVAIEVTFAPGASLAFLEALRIASDDPDDPLVAVPLTGMCPSAEWHLEALIAYVEGLDIHQGTKNGLLAKLSSALKKVRRGQPEKAVGNLRAFLHEVEAQRGKKIPEEIADELILRAAAIIRLLAPSDPDGDAEKSVKSEKSRKSGKDEGSPGAPPPVGPPASSAPSSTEGTASPPKTTSSPPKSSESGSPGEKKGGEEDDDDKDDKEGKKLDGKGDTSGLGGLGEKAGDTKGGAEQKGAGNEGPGKKLDGDLK